MGQFGVVGGQMSIEVGQHLFDPLIEVDWAHDAKVFVEQGSVQAFDEAVGLGTATWVVRCSMSSSWRNSF